MIQKKMLCTALIGLASTGTVVATTLSYDHQQQEHSLWCWLATARNVLTTLGKTVTQCELANWSLDRTDACGNKEFSWKHPANTPGPLYGGKRGVDSMLKEVGIGSYPYDYPVGWNGIKINIDRGRPVIAQWEWTFLPTSHLVTIFGYTEEGGENYVNYSDPFPDEGKKYAKYSWVREGGEGTRTHKWTFSLEIN